MHAPRIRVHCCLVLTVVFLAGCFGSGERQFDGLLQPVNGTVNVDGAPAANVEVKFIPTGETPGTGGSAVTDADGTYVLQHRSGVEGIEVGTYKVVFSQLLKADGTPLGPQDDAAILGVQKLPADYTKFETTKVTAEVPTGGSMVLDFDLQVNRK